MTGVAVLLTGFEGQGQVRPPLLPVPLARHVFGREVVDEAARQVSEILAGLGYIGRDTGIGARTLLARLMLTARSPRFEDLTDVRPTALRASATRCLDWS